MYKTQLNVIYERYSATNPDPDYWRAVSEQIDGKIYIKNPDGSCLIVPISQQEREFLANARQDMDFLMRRVSALLSDCFEADLLIREKEKIEDRERTAEWARAVCEEECNSCTPDSLPFDCEECLYGLMRSYYGF